MKKLFVKSSHVFLMFMMVLWSVAPGLGAFVNKAQAEEIAPTDTPIVESDVTPVVEPIVTPSAVTPVVEQTTIPTDKIVTPATDEIAPVIETAPAEEVVTPEETVPAESVATEKAQPVLSAWANDGNKYTTTSTVELGTTYTSPQNDQVTVTFTKLPDNPGKLSIEEITLTAEQVASLGALSDKAYDVTSDMADGTFAYDLTLPKPTDKNDVQIKYAENIAGLENTNTVATSDTTTETDSVSASLDHFTIFVVAGVTPPSCTGASITTETGDKCFNTIQAAIDDQATVTGSIIKVYPGIYSEGNTLRDIYTGGPGSYSTGLLVYKSGITIEGVDASGHLITDKSNLPTIIATQRDISLGDTIITGDNVTLSGLKFQLANIATVTCNKNVFATGENFTLKNSVIDNVNTGCSGLYISDERGNKHVNNFNIQNNQFIKGEITVINGVGQTGAATGRTITGNIIQDITDFAGISLTSNTGRSWDAQPIGDVTITGNTFSNNAYQIIARGSDYTNPNWANLLSQNTFDKAVITLTPSGDAQINSYDRLGYMNDLSDVSKEANFRMIGTNIQEAIQRATTGDTINVAAGTYTEHIIINKSVSLIGAANNPTIIDGNNSGTVVAITASNVTFKNFTVKNSGTVSDNGDGGIVLSGSTGSIINDNLITNNLYGILVGIYQGDTSKDTYSSGNTISGNTIKASSADGIYVDKGSNGNTIQNNSISGTTGSADGDGIYFWMSEGNTVTGNNINNNVKNGIEISGNVNSTLNNNTISSNTIHDNNIGVMIRNAHAGTQFAPVTNNKIYNNTLVNLYADPDTGLDISHNYWGFSDEATIISKLASWVTNIPSSPLVVTPGTTTNLNYTPWYVDEAKSTLSNDTTLPTLTSVSILSSNSHPNLAKIGDIVTLSFTANKNIQTPTVTIAGSNQSTGQIVVTGSGSSFEATYTALSGKPESVIPFTINFTDLAGNAGTQVTLTTNSSAVTADYTAPTFVTFANETVKATSGAGATVNYDLPTTDDVNATVTCTPVISITNNVFPVGTTRVNCTATDLAGNSDVQDIYINVNDITAPVITRTGDATVSVLAGSTYTDAGATANDDVDGNITSRIVTVNPVDTSRVGTYTITYNVSDSSTTNTENFGLPNRATQVTRTVIVKMNPNQVETNLVTTTANGSTTGTIPTATNLAVTSNDISATVNIPAGTVVTGPAGWDGTINSPTVVTTTVNPTPANGTSVSDVSSIELGFGDTHLTFNNPVSITFVGKANSLVGWSQNGIFHNITNTCNSATNPTLEADSDCKINVGNDLVVWTRHFTTFTSYTQQRTNSSSGSSARPATSTASQGQVLGASTQVGQVLGAEKFMFSMFLKKGSKGNEVIELQKFLNTAGYNCGTADGKFGPKTLAALAKFQIVNKLKGDGIVGPMTRAVLNK